MTLGILLSVAAATSYTFNTLLLMLLGRKAFTSTRYIFLIALAANLLIHLAFYGRIFPRFEEAAVLGYITMISALPLIGPRLLLQTISQLLSKKGLLEGVPPLSAKAARLSSAPAGILLFSLLAVSCTTLLILC